MTGNATASGSVENWKKNAPIQTSDHYSDLCIGGIPRNIFMIEEGYYSGKIEDLALYPLVIYPIDPVSGRYTITKALSEFNSDSASISKSVGARLFIKDYHNIRGKTHKHIGMSGEVYFRKAAPVLDGRTS